MSCAKKISLYGVLCALCLIFGYIETLIPVVYFIPGMKIGLANIIVLFALYRLGVGAAAMINAVRIALSAVLFGSVISFAFALCGGTLALLCMIGLKKADVFSVTAVSVCAAVAHNLGQIAVAAVMLSGYVYGFLPFLIISGAVCGLLTGVAGAVMIRRIRVEK